jgi:hypothetical protein
LHEEDHLGDHTTVVPNYGSPAPDVEPGFV